MFEAAYSQVSAPPGRILSIPDEGVACAISALLGQGWVLQVVTRGCRLTKSCPEYLPMVFELRLRWRSPRVYAGGRLLLHGRRCLGTPCFVAPALQALAMVPEVARATQALSLFGDVADL